MKIARRFAAAEDMKIARRFAAAEDMKIARRFAAAALLIFVGLPMAGTPGCAGRSVAGRGATVGAGDAEGREPLTQARLEMLFAENVDAISGPPGAIQSVVDGVRLYLISDPENDRMQLLAPIVQATALDPQILEVMLQANFHTTLDARYAISDEIVFAAFLHPISSLSPELLRSAMAQVVSLARTFGTTFSSGEPGAPAEP